MTITTLLVILDGWGLSDKGPHNAVHLGKTPNYDRMVLTYPWTKLQASEEFVGLPKGQMGNSEVGHLNIGAGRCVKQLFPRITDALSFPSFVDTVPVLHSLIQHLRLTKQRLHLFGLLSPGGIHSHQSHLEAVYDAFTAEGIPVVMHAFTDGRDTPPSSAINYVQAFCSGGKRCIHTLGGRYYGMDRDQRWDRIQKAYNAIIKGDGPQYLDPISHIQTAYKQGNTDEFIQPGVWSDYQGFQSGDAVLMLNFRADRVRQLLTAVLDPEFIAFDLGEPPNVSQAAGLVSYSDTLDSWMEVCFPAEELNNTLGEYVAAKGLRQLRVAETEKYAHVTFFFNGGREEPFPNEDRVLVPSPNVATYDLKPTMAAEEVTAAVLKGIGHYDLIVVNYANPDMVGHTGVLEASIEAVETIDSALGQLETAILNNDGTMIITADHGNIEMLWDATTQQPHTAHTMNPVPLIIVSSNTNIRLTEGALCDIAPTVLRIIKQEKPAEMTGKCLIQ